LRHYLSSKIAYIAFSGYTVHYKVVALVLKETPTRYYTDLAGASGVVPQHHNFCAKTPFCTILYYKENNKNISEPRKATKKLPSKKIYLIALSVRIPSFKAIP